MVIGEFSSPHKNRVSYMHSIRTTMESYCGRRVSGAEERPVARILESLQTGNAFTSLRPILKEHWNTAVTRTSQSDPASMHSTH